MKEGSTDSEAFVRGKSNQLKALFRKTLVQQKRQVVSNIACLLVLPCLMIFATAYTASLDSFNASAAVQTVTYCSNTPRLQSNGLPITHLSQILPENTSVSNTSLVRRQATIRVGDPCIGSINGATMCLANIPGVLFRCDGGYWQGDRCDQNNLVCGVDTSGKANSFTCVDPATVTAPNTTCSLTDADKTVCYGASLLTCTGGSWIQQACPQGQNCILNSQRVGAQCLASTSIPSLSNNQIPLSVNFLSLGQGQVPQSCVHWFGDAYPANSPIYEKNANLSGIGKLDTTGVPPPNNGWIGLLLQHIEAPTPEGLLAVQQLTRLQMSEWALSGSRPELAEVLGLSPQQSPPLSTDQVQKLDASKILTPTFDVQSGLLGSIPKRLFASFDGTSVRFQQYPYFNVSGSFQSTTDVDDAIASTLKQVISNVGSLNKTAYMAFQANKPYDQAELESFYASLAAIIAQLPYGGLFLDQFNAATLSSTWYLNYGTDARLQASPVLPGAGSRLLSQLAKLGQAQLRAMAGGNATLKGATLTQGVRAFPRTEAHAVTGGSKTAGKTGDLVFPFAVSFLLPVFVVMLVKEKEEKILIMMKMNGMKTWVYYLSHYLTCFTLYAFSTICFCVAGFLTKIPLFKLTSPVVLAVLFILWGNAQVCLSFFLSTLFKQSRNALVMTYLIALIGVVVATVLAILYEGKPQLSVINMWPPFAFYRGLLLANAATYIDGQSPYEASQLAGNTELRSVCLWLFFDGVGYALLAAYLQAVLPTDFGVQFPWHFPFTAPLRAMERRNRRKANGGVDSEFELAVINAATENLDSREDDDVRAERTRVDNRAYPQDANVVISHMKKVYPSRKGLGPKVGVRDVTFAEESGTILGLLGPNGAGKTTLISILSGLFEASSGEARIAGFDLKTQTSQVYDNIGICPQFDIHWSNLTVEEHLYFYSRLKGIPGQLEEAAVQRSLRQVSLDTLKTRLASQLSGGEKRRLSIAIALVGNPSVIFLDEPTTGLDPEVRRLIWNIIQSNRVGKTIMLTTHSMEEAEALCTRIGIMAKGSLRCIGNPLRLKELYGSGFKLSFISNAEETQRACEFVESVMPTGWRKMDAFATSTAYEFPAAERAKIPAMFGLIEKCKAEHGILQWSISQTTLEEVFVHIISGDDANAD